MGSAGNFVLLTADDGQYKSGFYRSNNVNWVRAEAERSVPGTIIASDSNFADFPAAADSEGSFAILTVSDGAYQAGIYQSDGAVWSLILGLAVSPGSIITSDDTFSSFPAAATSTGAYAVLQAVDGARFPGLYRSNASVWELALGVLPVNALGEVPADLTKFNGVIIASGTITGSNLSGTNTYSGTFAIARNGNNLDLIYTGGSVNFVSMPEPESASLLLLAGTVLIRRQRRIER